MTALDRAPAAVRFHHPQLGAVGVEVLHLDTLRRRVSRAHLAAPQRVEFFLLLFVAEGELRHLVDFTEFTLPAGSLVVVRPGQVQHWHLHDGVEGCLVLIDPPALTPIATVGHAQRDRHRDALLEAMVGWPPGVRLDPDFATELRDDLGRLARDIERFDGTTHDVTLIRQYLLALLLRVARWHRRRAAEDAAMPASPASAASASPAAALQQLHRLFQTEVERHYRSARPVAEYARRLGYSVSTLDRACRAVSGVPAKVLLDRRRAMEAARLLVHSPAGVAEIARALGFTEATNFARFFARMVGETPARFRERHGRADGTGAR